MTPTSSDAGISSYARIGAIPFCNLGALMPKQDNNVRPKAQSIIVLGFSRTTRHFLFKLGIKTVDSLSRLDADYLACNGASKEILAEVQSYLGEPNLSANSETEDVTEPEKNKRGNRRRPPPEQYPRNIAGRAQGKRRGRQTRTIAGRSDRQPSTTRNHRLPQTS